MLAVLVERAGHVVARETLLTSVWPDTHVHPDNVKVLVGEIRRALGDEPTRPRFIRSLVKRGYIFIAPVVDAPLDLSAGSPSPIFVGREAEMERLLGAVRRGGGFASAGRLRDRRRRHRQDRALRGVSPRRRDAPSHAGDVGAVHAARRAPPNRTIRCSTCSRASRAPPTTKPSPPRWRDWHRAGCRISPVSADDSVADLHGAGTHDRHRCAGCCVRS